MEAMLASPSVPWAALQMGGQNFILSTACGPWVCFLSELKEELHGATQKGSLGPGGHRVFAVPVQQVGSSSS